MNFTATVILCTHNPRREYLSRTLAALRTQTLPTSEWELLVIDNASAPSLDSWVDLAWHPNARIIREEKLGLTPARLCGIGEGRAELLVFVDDDNVLDENYLAAAQRIGHEFPFLGVWGGQVLPEYETPPPAWAEAYVASLALFSCERDVWSNVGDGLCLPCGAGLCSRAAVAQEYLAQINHSGGLRAMLDRRGADLTAGGDNDLALTAIDLGLATGRFRSLTMKHLIPAERLSEDYLLRLKQGNAYSSAILSSLRRRARNQFSRPPPAGHAVDHLFQLLNRLPFPSRARRFRLATKRGLVMAGKLLNTQP